MKSAPLETLDRRSDISYNICVFFDFCCYGGRCTRVSPYREIGLARNVEVKISKMFQKGFKLTFSKGHFKIFHNNIFIFQPYTGLEKLLKYLHFYDFTKKAYINIQGDYFIE